MFTEIVKIIQGGLAKDTQKVASYAKLLADNLSKDGDSKLADKILRVLQETKSQAVYLDQLVSTPVDQETRLNIVDFYPPEVGEIKLVFSKETNNSIKQFIDFNIHKNKLKAAGVEINSSLLLYGPPGCGKTSIARYIAKTLDLPLVVARLDSLVSSLLGNTSKNIRKAFEFASKHPCVLFIDEFDAIAKARDDQHELGELKRVINSLLQNMDEFTPNNILIAATNHHELLDKAIWRRFNHIIEVGIPPKKELSQILSSFFTDQKLDFLDDTKKADRVSSLLDGFSPADIKNIYQNAIARKIISGDSQVTFENFIMQIFHFQNHGKYEQEELIKFLNTQGSPQQTIAEICNISLRQVRNVIN